MTALAERGSQPHSKYQGRPETDLRVTHCAKSKEINLSPPPNWLLRLTHKERLSALEFVPRYVYFPECPVSMRTIRDCNASALIPARKSSIAVLSPRLFFRRSTSANESKGFYA